MTSVVRSELNGLKAAALLVEPPSAACHWSRSATLAAVAGAAHTLQDAQLPSRRQGRVDTADCAAAGLLAVQAGATAQAGGRKGQQESDASEYACHERSIRIGYSASREWSGPGLRPGPHRGPPKVGTFNPLFRHRELHIVRLGAPGELFLCGDVGFAGLKKLGLGRPFSSVTSGADPGCAEPAGRRGVPVVGLTVPAGFLAAWHDTPSSGNVQSSVITRMINFQ